MKLFVFDFDAISDFLKKSYSQDARRFLLYTCLTLLLLNVYFVFHIFTGRNSVLSHQELIMARDMKSAQLIEIKNKNEQIVHELNLLQNNAIDVDYLEELARIKLNYSYRDEKIIVNRNVIIK